MLPISFTLVADELGIKHMRKEAGQHLIETIRKQCEMSTDWNGKKYLGLELE